jgi:uncharacterized protein YndB with AHSA1/START domain
MKLDVERDVFGHRTVAGAVHRGRSIRVQERYHAPPGRVFDAWLDPETARRWLFATASHPMTHVSIDARVNGSFRLADREGAETLEFTGRYREIDPPRRLVFTLRWPRRPQMSLVTVTLAPRGIGCALELIHEHLSSDDARDVEDRWTGILYGLGVTLDSLPERSNTFRSQR